MSSRVFKYRVHANQGFKSEPMDYHQAVNYASKLLLLGNENVKVKRVENKVTSSKQRQKDLKVVLDALLSSVGSKYDAV